MSISAEVEAVERIGRMLAATAVANALAEAGVVTNATLLFSFRGSTEFENHSSGPNRLHENNSGSISSAESSRLSLLPLAEVLDFGFGDLNSSTLRQQWSFLCAEGLNGCTQTDQAYEGGRSPMLDAVQHFWHACTASAVNTTSGCSLVTYFSSLALARASSWSFLPPLQSSTPLLSLAERVWRGWRGAQGGKQASKWLHCMLPPLLLQQEVGRASLQSPLRGPGVWSWSYAPALLARWVSEAAVEGGQEAQHRVEGLCSTMVNMTNSMWQSVTSSRAGDSSPAYTWAAHAHASIGDTVGAAHPAALGALYAKAALAEEAGQPGEAMALQRTLRTSLQQLLAPWYASWCFAASSSHVHTPPWCSSTGAEGVAARVEGHPLYILSLLSSAEALASRGQYSRAQRYSARAAHASLSLLPPAHALSAMAAGMQAVVAEGAAIAAASVHCVANNSVCRERAALSVSSSVWPAYEHASRVWAGVESGVRAGSMEYAAFQRARALAAFRKGWGGRLDIFQASILSSLLNSTCPECAGPQAALPLGAATWLAYATGLVQEGQHAQATAAWSALYNASTALLHANSSSPCASDLLSVLRAASLAGREQALVSWAGHGEGACAGDGGKQAGKDSCPISSLIDLSQAASGVSAHAAGLTYNPWSIPDLQPAYRRTRRTQPPGLAAATGHKQENLIITQAHSQQGSGPLKRVQAEETVHAPATSPPPLPSSPVREGRDRAAAWGTPAGAVSRKRKGASSSPSPAALPPSTAPASGLDLTARLSEFFLRHGMSVYGCKLLTDATRSPGGRPELQSFPPVKCESSPHPLAPPGLAAMYNPAGFEDPSRRDMLTATGMTYLQALLKDVAAIEARGQAWELAVAKSSEDIAGRPYAAVGLLVPVILPPGTKPGGGQQKQQQGAAAATPVAPLPSRPPAQSRSRSLSSSDVMTSIITLLSAVQGAIPPIHMEGGVISNRREILEWFARTAAGDRPPLDHVSAWSDDRLALWAHEAADRVPTWGQGQGQAPLHVTQPQATQRPSLGPGPWAPEVLGYVK